MWLLSCPWGQAQMTCQALLVASSAGKRAQALADEGRSVLDGLEAERKLLAQVRTYAP